jgi:hypothetical protein
MLSGFWSGFFLCVGGFWDWPTVGVVLGYWLEIDRFWEFFEAFSESFSPTVT